MYPRRTYIGDLLGPPGPVDRPLVHVVHMTTQCNPYAGAARW